MALEIVPAVPVVEFFLIDQGFLGVGVVKDFSRQVRTAVNYRQEGDNPDPAGDQQELVGLGRVLNAGLPSGSRPWSRPAGPRRR